MRTSNDQNGLPQHRGKGMERCTCEYPSYPMARPYTAPGKPEPVPNCDSCGKPMYREDDSNKSGAEIQANRRAAATKANSGGAY